MASGTRLIGRSDSAEVYCGSFYGAVTTAEMIAVDPPWRQGNLTYWSRRAGIEQVWDEFRAALVRVVSDSNPKIVYIKCGVKELPEWLGCMMGLGYATEQWETKYYAGTNAQLVCEKTRVRCPKSTDSRESTTMLAQWAAGKGITSAVDLCLGKGKMLKKFQAAGMRVAGIELAEPRAMEAAKRLGVLG